MRLVFVRHALSGSLRDRQPTQRNLARCLDAESHPISLDSLDMNANVRADLQHFTFFVGQDQHLHLRELGLPPNPDRNKGGVQEVNYGRPHSNHSSKKG